MIRRAEEKDIERIKDLLHQVQNVHADGRPDIFIHGAMKYSEEEIKAIIQDDCCPVYVYLDEADVVQGYAFCIHEIVEGSNNCVDRRTCYIDDLCVEETCRHSHIGQQLYEYVVETARAAGFDSITLNVWECNPTARRFYDKMGLIPLKTTLEYTL